MSPTGDCQPVAGRRPSTNTHRHEDLVLAALDQQGHRLVGLRHHIAHLVDAVDRRAVDSEQHVARLHAGARRRAAGAPRPTGRRATPAWRFSCGCSGRSARPSLPLAAASSLLATLAAFSLASPSLRAQLDSRLPWRQTSSCTLLARRRLADERRQVARGHDRLAVDLADHVARLAGPPCRPGRRFSTLDTSAPSGLSSLNESASVWFTSCTVTPSRACCALPVATIWSLMLDRDVDRDRERHALVAARAAVDLRVDAHHLAARVEQRTARVAGVDRHVGLDEGHGAVVGQRAALGAHHAGRHGVLEAERRADREHPFAHAQVVACCRAAPPAGSWLRS